MTNVFSSLPRKTAQPRAAGISPLMVATTTSFGMAETVERTFRTRKRVGTGIAGRQLNAARNRGGILFKAEKMNVPFAGLLEHCRFIENQDFARLECRGPDAGL